MELSNLPKEDQEPKSKSDEIPKAGEQARRKPKLVVYRGMLINRPGEMDKTPESIAKEKLSSRPASGSQDKDEPASRPDATSLSTDSSYQAKSQPTHTFPSSEQGDPPRTGEDDNPGRRLHAFEAAAKNAPPAKVPWRYRLRPNRELARRAYWDVTATFSLIVNVILVGLLLVMAQQIRNLRTTVNTLGNTVLGGLYSNFVKMDQASINTTITVNTQVPLNFNLPVSQNTQVVLTRDVSIPGAHVVINTGILNINAQANVTLPAGTSLPIALNLDIPVQTTIPISLQVPVNIPMSQTELHEPFTSLQTALRPLYCTFNKNAQYPEGIFICAEHDAATPSTP